MTPTRRLNSVAVVVPFHNEAAGAEAFYERLREQLDLIARPYTLVFGDVGVRVPNLTPEADAVVRAVGVVAATSANLSGGSDSRRVEDIPEEIRAACGAIVDAGELPGVASTVIDLTGEKPRVLRQGAGPLHE